MILRVKTFGQSAASVPIRVEIIEIFEIRGENGDAKLAGCDQRALNIVDGATLTNFDRTISVGILNFLINSQFQIILHWGVVELGQVELGQD